jgi:hypothetical protein
VHRGIVCLLLALAGCDKVLGIQPNPAADASQNVCFPGGGPLDNDDGDSKVNGEDPCPRFANEGPGDEDGDKVLDDCDLCPQLDGEPGTDVDCDDIGAACDPQAGVVNTRRFFGFGNQSGVSLYKTVIENGVARMPATNSEQTFTLGILDPGALPAHFATQVTIKNARVAQYWSFVLTLKVAAQTYEIQLEKQQDSHTLAFVAQHAGFGDLVRKVIAPLATGDITFTIATSLTSTQLAAEINIVDVGVTKLESPVVTGASVSYGFAFYRDQSTVVTTTTAETPYFVYTALVP